ncbi:MAG: Bax inhibitor-1/YccA family protein [Clostridia bacterium]|nr:Bax inhibitor-1/YccA family protein [Clostridia bacterium]
MRVRLGNPALRRMVSNSERYEAIDSPAATYKGVYLKAALYAALTIIAAVATEFILLWSFANGYIEQALIIIGIAFAACGIPTLVIALVIAFVPSTAKVLGCIYAVLQGGSLGVLALFVDIFFPGIAFAAFLGTALVFLVAIVVNSVFKVRISSRFVRGLMVALFCLLAVQLVMWVLSLFTGFDYTTYMWIQIVISSLCIIWATVMIFWDLQNVDYLVQSGADKKYEWNVAFSLVTTLIYLYVEILELLVRIAALFSNNRR